MKITDAQTEALEQANTAVVDAKAALKDANDDRTRLVRELAAAGYSFRSISTPAGLSYQRIAQLVGAKDDRLTLDATLDAYCPKCGAAPGAQCEGASGYFHNERHHRRNAIHDGEIDDIVEGEPGYVFVAVGRSEDAATDSGEAA